MPRSHWFGILAGVSALALFSRYNLAALEKTADGGPGRIICRLEGSGPQVDIRLAVISLADKKVRPLTEFLPYRSQPSGPHVLVSPDGKTAAYLAERTSPPDGGRVTWTIFARPLDNAKANARSLEVSNVTNMQAWSPDGTKLLVMTGEESKQLIVDLKTNQAEPLSLP